MSKSGRFTPSVTVSLAWTKETSVWSQDDLFEIAQQLESFGLHNVEVEVDRGAVFASFSAHSVETIECGEHMHPERRVDLIVNVHECTRG